MNNRGDFQGLQTRATEKEAKQAERQVRVGELTRQLKELRHEAVMEQIGEAGLAFDDYDDAALVYVGVAGAKHGR